MFGIVLAKSIKWAIYQKSLTAFCIKSVKDHAFIRVFLYIFTHILINLFLGGLMSKYAFLYFIIINTATMLLMYIDKTRARSHAWRIPESLMFTASFIGGAIGTLLGMELFRHKTKHIKFKLGIPALIIVNLIVYYLVLYYIYVV